MQRVVTTAGDSVVGTQGGGMNGHVIEGKRVRGGLGGGQGEYRAAEGRAVGAVVGAGKQWERQRKSVANRGKVLYD